MAINQRCTPNLPFDPIRDFESVIMVAPTYYLLLRIPACLPLLWPRSFNWPKAERID
jgi:hypothetical protein